MLCVSLWRMKYIEKYVTVAESRGRVANTPNSY
jgi:hypothetical protein